MRRYSSLVITLYKLWRPIFDSASPLVISVKAEPGVKKEMRLKDEIPVKFYGAL